MPVDPPPMTIVPPPGIDSAVTTMRFEVSIEVPGQGHVEAKLEAVGRTWVERGQAVPSGYGRFTAPLRMVASPHTGQHEILGEFHVDVRSDLPSFGALDGELDPTDDVPVLGEAYPASGWFELHLLIRTRLGTLHTAGVPARVVNPHVTTLFPDTPYSHAAAAARLELFLAGTESAPVGTLGPGSHEKGEPAVEEDPGCAPEAYLAVAVGHRGCFELAAGAERDLYLDNAPHPGSVITTGNTGSTPLTLSWQSAGATRSQTVPPRSSFTLLTPTEVRVGPATPGDSPRGWYLASRCCS